MMAMPGFRRLPGKLHSLYSKPALRSLLLPLALLLLLLLPLWWAASLWYGDALIQQRRAEETIRVAVHGNALATAINGRFALLEGLCAFALANPSTEHLNDHFEIFARGLYSGARGVRNFALAPGGVQRYVYPLLGNEGVLGHDLVNDKRDWVRSDVRRAMKRRETTISGPYELRQGGMGLVARKALYADGKYWGLAAMVIDLPPVFIEAGLDPPQPGRETALRDGGGRMIFGDGALFEKDPVLLRIALPEGAWELGALPDGGWTVAASGRLRLSQGLGLVMVALLFALALLVANRQSSLKAAIAARTRELERELAQRKQKERELEQSEGRCRSFFDQSIDAVLQTTLDGQILDANPEACRLFGRTVEEIRRLGKAEWVDLTDPRLAPAIEEQRRTGRFKGELTFVHKDGSRFPGEVSSGLFADFDGNLRTSMIIRDMTERREMGREMRTTAELLQMTGEMAKVGGWEFDAESGRGHWTKEVAMIHDLDPVLETNVQTGLRFYSGESRERIEKAVTEAVERGVPYDLELEMVSAAGNRKWIRTMGIPVMEGEKVKKVRGIFQDITMRKRAEEELAKHRGHLEDLVEERTAELGAKIAEVERMNRLFVGRELRMAELKERIAELQQKSGPDPAG